MPEKVSSFLSYLFSMILLLLLCFYLWIFSLLRWVVSSPTFPPLALLATEVPFVPVCPPLYVKLLPLPRRGPVWSGLVWWCSPPGFTKQPFFSWVKTSFPSTIPPVLVWSWPALYLLLVFVAGSLFLKRFDQFSFSTSLLFWIFVCRFWGHLLFRSFLLFCIAVPNDPESPLAVLLVHGQCLAREISGLCGQGHCSTSFVSIPRINLPEWSIFEQLTSIRKRKLSAVKSLFFKL